MRRIVNALLLFLAVVSTPTRSQAQPQPQNSLVGILTEVPDQSKLKGSQVTITGLSSSVATMVWPDGYETRLTKIFENANLIILQSVGAVGSTETAYLDVANRKFLVVSVGAFAIAVKGNSISVSHYRGYLK